VLPKQAGGSTSTRREAKRPELRVPIAGPVAVALIPMNTFGDVRNARRLPKKNAAVSATSFSAKGCSEMRSSFSPQKSCLGPPEDYAPPAPPPPPAVCPNSDGRDELRVFSLAPVGWDLPRPRWSDHGRCSTISARRSDVMTGGGRSSDRGDGQSDRG
jgi:hypothetical protein